MNRKPALTRIREKILVTLPMLPDADLAHIASLCDGLPKLRAQERRTNLQPQFKVSASKQNGVFSGADFFELPAPADGQAQAPNDKARDE